MSSLTTLIQIILLVVAIGIGVTYLKPTFEDIQGIQDDIAIYEDEIKNVAAVNATLDLLYSRVVEMDTDYKKSLHTYLPDEVDQLSVMKDIVTIAEMDENLTVSAVTPEKLEMDLEIFGSDEEDLIAHSFMVDFHGPYESVKEFLRRVERNNYQMMVSDIALTPAEVEAQNGIIEDGITAQVTFVTFALPVKINDKD